MNNAAQQIVNKAWNFAHVLRDDGLSYMAYTEQITFLLAAHAYVTEHYGKELDPEQKKHLREDFAQGWELVPGTARLAIMNIYLHGINADPCPIRSGVDTRHRVAQCDRPTPLRIRAI